MGEHQREVQAGRIAELKERTFGETIHLVNGCLTAESGFQEWNWKHREPVVEHGQIWAVNGYWTRYRCDIGFEMHDLGGPSYDAMEEYKDWYINTALLGARIPVFHPWELEGAPNVLRYPLEPTGNDPLPVYFGESPNYMIRLAILWGAREIVLHEFWYPDDYPKPGERASTEFWLGYAMASGVSVLVAGESSNVLIPDKWEPFYNVRMYGYRADDHR